MFSIGVQNPKHLRFQRQSWAEDGLNDCETGSGRADLDEFGPGTGDKCVQKCVIAGDF